MPSKKKWLYVVFGLLIILVSEYSKKKLNFYDIFLSKDGSELQGIEKFPYLELSGGRDYLYYFKLSGKSFAYWKIVPDNELKYIKINGRIVDLSGVDRGALKDWSNGFQMPFDSYLTSGENTFEIKVVNSGGPASLKIMPQGIGYYGWVSRLFAVFGFVLLCMPLVRMSSVKYRWVFFLVCVVIGYYNAYTGYLHHGHDVEAHIEYVDYLIEHIKPPPPFGGWEFHQPPLYYYLVLPLYLAGDIIPWVDKYELMQYFSAYLMVIFLFYSCRIFRLFYPEEDLRFVCCMLLMCFWPSIIIHSSRVGNDIAFYCFAIICFYYICCWWRDDRARYFVLSAVFCSLAVMSKSNGIVLVATAGSLYLMRVYSAGFGRSFEMLKLALLVSPILLFGFAVSFGDSLYYQYIGEGGDALLGTSINSLNGKLFVGNEPRNYLMFDVQTFLTEPFALPWDDVAGRQYFWNYFLKSSLFGEFTFDSNYHRFVALMLAPVCLLIFVVTLLGIIKEWKSREKAPLLLFAFFSILAVIVFRSKAPASPHGDFRFVLPIICCFFVYFSQACDPHRYLCWKNVYRLGLSGFLGFLSLQFFMVPS